MMMVCPPSVGGGNQMIGPSPELFSLTFLLKPLGARRRPPFSLPLPQDTPRRPQDSSKTLQESHKEPKRSPGALPRSPPGGQNH